MNGEKNDVSDRSAGRSEKRKGSLMSVRELGETLGLKKTERYRLMHMGWFETTEYLGKMWVIRDSFEKWYANQTRYRKADGEEPGRELKEWSYSMRDIARMFGMSETTVYGIVERNRTDHVDGRPDYSLLTAEFFANTFAEVDEVLRKALHAYAIGSDASEWGSV